METNTVSVNLWGAVVGYLSWDKRRKIGVFEYDVDFLKRGLDIAPLTMSVFSPRSQKGMPWLGDSDKLYQGLPPMLADSLPDKWGNSLFNVWLMENKISKKHISPVDHLSFIGSRAMGALEFEPAHELGDNSAFTIDVQKLYNFSKEVLSEREATVLDEQTTILWQDLIKISSSPGGKRPKAIVAINKATGEVKSGQGRIDEGFVHYILKYDENSAYPFAKLEYVYYLLALDAGITMMPSELRSYGGVQHFLTQRFDRKDNERIHTQTLAAMNPQSSSYEDVFAVMRKLNLPYSDIRQQYIRMVYNVLARNVDDHSKNISFSMTSDGVWRLSPAYDLTYSVDLMAPAYSNRHSLTVNGKDEDISLADLEMVARNNDIRDCKTLLGNVKEAVAKFNDFAKRENIDSSLIGKIRRDFSLV